MPAGGRRRLTFATLLGAADALVIESVEDDVVILSDGYGLHEGAPREHAAVRRRARLAPQLRRPRAPRRLVLASARGSRSA